MDIQKRNAQIVKQLCNSIRDQVVLQIKSGKHPDNWDGHELRSLLADKFRNEITASMSNKRSQRVKDFKNEVLVRNL